MKAGTTQMGAITIHPDKHQSLNWLYMLKRKLWNAQFTKHDYRAEP